MLVFMNFQGRKCTNFFVNLTDFFKKQFNYTTVILIEKYCNLNHVLLSKKILAGGLKYQQ